jgi:hypothetical protein
MKQFLKDGDEVVADNIKLEYVDGKFTLPADGLNHAVKYVFDIETELECELLFESNETELKPYYDKPVIN